MAKSIFQRKGWSSEEDQIIRVNYPNKFHFELLKLLPNRTKMAIKLRARLLGVKRDYECRRGEYRKTKYYRNRKFFNELNLLNCYWAGFIAADGGIEKDHSRIYIKVSSLDKNHLEKFAKCVDFNGPIRTYWETTDKGTNEFSRIAINSVHEWIQDLEKYFNIHQCKTIDLKEPNLDIYSDFALAYLAGFIDGDGSILVPKIKVNGNYYQQVYVSIVGTMGILIWIKKLFDLRFVNDNYYLSNRIAQIKECNNTDVVNRYITGGFRVLEFINKVKKFGLPLLNRKWDKIDDLILGRCN